MLKRKTGDLLHECGKSYLLIHCCSINLFSKALFPSLVSLLLPQVRQEDQLPDVQRAERHHGDHGGRGSELRDVTGLQDAVRLRSERRLGGRIRAE